MKLRHAAALALVGWFILIPPVMHQGEKPDTSVPLKEWMRYKEYAPTWYGSKAACEKDVAIKRALDPMLYQAKCVSKDDPRLAGGLGQP